MEENLEEKRFVKQILFTFLILFTLGGFGGIYATQGTMATAAQDELQNGVSIETQAEASEAFVQTTPYNMESLKAAINNVLAQYLPGARLLDLKETNINGKTFCICKVSYRNTVIDLTIDPKTGAIKGAMEGETLNGPDMAVNSAVVRVSTKQVNEILNKTMPGARVSRTHYNKKDGTIEGFLTYQSFRYYFKINAKTGEIVTMQQMNG